MQTESFKEFTGKKVWFRNGRKLEIWRIVSRFASDWRLAFQIIGRCRVFPLKDKTALWLWRRLG
jgi:hypothetical protein